MIRTALVVVGIVVAGAGTLCWLFVEFCDAAKVSGDNERLGIARQKEAVWSGPCSDSVAVLGPTGTSNAHACSNKSHRMRMEVKTSPSNEQIGAIVFCECVKTP